MVSPPAAILLASASPRRRELLEQIGVAFSLIKVEVDERRQPGEAPEAMVQRLALAKARAGRSAAAADARPVLGADTVVVVDDAVLGKPRDEAHALAMLARLSGRWHEVLSAVALAWPGGEEVRLSRTAVRFREISETEARAYWASGEPRDKAGAYAIQGRGAVFVAEIRGSYSGVMGLPLFETAELLAARGVRIL